MRRERRQRCLAPAGTSPKSRRAKAACAGAGRRALVGARE